MKKAKTTVALILMVSLIIGGGISLLRIGELPDIQVKSNIVRNV